MSSIINGFMGSMRRIDANLTIAQINAGLFQDLITDPGTVIDKIVGIQKGNDIRRVIEIGIKVQALKRRGRIADQPTQGNRNKIIVVVGIAAKTLTPRPALRPGEPLPVEPITCKPAMPI